MNKTTNGDTINSTLNGTPVPAKEAGEGRTDAHVRSSTRPSVLNKAKRTLINLWNRLIVFFAKNVYEEVLIKSAKERFYLVFGGHIFFQTLYAAVKLDLFTHLDEHPGLTCAEIASSMALAKQPVRILLLGLTAVGFVRKKGEKYSLPHLSKQLLSRNSSKNVIPYVYLEHDAMYKAMPHFYDSIREYRNVGIREFAGNEPTFYQRLEHNLELEKIFQDAMQALSVQTNGLFARFVDLSNVKHLVDVGGGDGTNIISLAQRNPHLNATVFDLPAACDIARKNIAKHELSHRLHVVPGNCFQHEFPKNADAFLFSHFFTIWSEKRDRYLLKKCFSALPKGGCAMIFNMMQNDDGTGPLSAAVGSPYFLTLATGEGMLYCWKEYESWFKEAGFKRVKRIVLPSDHGVIIGFKE